MFKRILYTYKFKMYLQGHGTGTAEVSRISDFEVHNTGKQVQDLLVQLHHKLDL